MNQKKTLMVIIVLLMGVIVFLIVKPGKRCLAASPPEIVKAN